MKNLEVTHNIDGHQYCSIDTTGNATNSFPQETLLLNKCSIKAELAITPEVEELSKLTREFLSSNPELQVLGRDIDFAVTLEEMVFDLRPLEEIKNFLWDSARKLQKPVAVEAACRIIGKGVTFSPNEDVDAVIKELLSYGIAPMAVSPVRDARDEGCHRVDEGNYKKFSGKEITKDTKLTYEHCLLDSSQNPLPRFTGKTPSFQVSDGRSFPIAHKKFHAEIPDDETLTRWFSSGESGVGALGGFNGIVWLDFDRKTFESQDQCDEMFFSFLQRNNLEEYWHEQSGGGGYRVPVRVEVLPDYKDMAFVGVDKHIGEVISVGSFAVLAPSRHPNGKHYIRLFQGGIAEVESLESLGICSAGGKEKTRSVFRGQRKEFTPGVSREGDLVDFLNNQVLPALDVLQIYNWSGHDFVDCGESLQGAPFGRTSASGQSFHLDFKNGEWLWFDFGSGTGGNAVQYRWMLKGGTGTPTGKDFVGIVQELAAQAGLELPKYTRPVDVATEFAPAAAVAEVVELIDFTTCEKSGVKVTRINKEFLTDSDLNLKRHTISVVISPKGTGKTKGLVAAVAKGNFQGVASWHTRISLAAKMASDLKIQFKPDFFSTKQSFCSNSAHKFNPRYLLEKGLLICDEFDQIMQYNFESLCNKDGMRPTVLKYFEAHLYAALHDGSALFMSEDITQKEIDFLRKIAPQNVQIELIINEFKPGRGQLLLSKDADCTGLLDLLKEKINEEVPCFVIDDLKDGVFGGKSIAQFLKEECPEIKIKVINSETSANEIDFISNINKESLDVDVIVCSPSITAGVSLENARFNFGVFLFANGIFDDNAASQALGRVRGAKELYVWCAKQGFNTEQSREFTPELVNKHYQEIELKRTSIMQSFNVSYDPLVAEFNSPYWELFCKNAAQKNSAMYDLRTKIKAKLIRDGYQLEEAKFSISKELSEETKDALKNSWGALKLGKVKAIDAVELPTQEEIEEIRSKIESQTSLSEKEQHQLIKFQLFNTFGEKLISESSALFGTETLTEYASMAFLNWNGDLEKTSYKYFNCFHQQVEDSINRDLRVDNAQKYLGSRFPGDIRFSMFDSELAVRLNLKQFVDPNVKFLDADCQATYDLMVEEFKSKPGHWVHKAKPAAAVAKLLREYGIRFATTADGKAPKVKIDGKQVRYYQPDATVLQFLEYFSEYRLSKIAPAFVIDTSESDLDSNFGVPSDEPDFSPSSRLEQIEESHIRAGRILLELRDEQYDYTEINAEASLEIPQKTQEYVQMTLGV